MAAPQAQLRVSRYFAVLAVIIAVLYALVFLTGPGSMSDRAKPKLGLDLVGGKTVTLTAKTKDNKPPKREDMETAVNILRLRIDSKGVAEPEILIDGDKNIVINVPGQSGADLNRVGQPAKMRFREVLQQAADSIAASAQASPSPKPSATPAPSGSPGTSPAPSTSPSGATVKSGGSGGGGGGMALAPTPAPSAPVPSVAPSPVPSAAPPKTENDEGQIVKQADVLKKLPPQIAQALQTGTPEQLASPQAQKLFEPVTKLSLPEIAVLPLEYQLKIPQITCDMLAHRPVGSLDDEHQQAVACEKDGHVKMLLDKSSVLGEDIKDASYAYDTTQGWKVSLTFTGDGSAKWTELTKKTVQKQVAVVLDNTIITAPTINQVITGPAEITGQFSQAEAANLASQLKFGALPLSFAGNAQQHVSATLGLASLKAGLLAGGIGLLLVVIYTLIYYRALGLVTIASLLASASIIYAAIVLLGRPSGIGFTLTLAGVAGFIVAVGITADSFVVFFERLKDEVKDGRSVRTAVPRAWTRARRTILSADSVSFLAAATLYIFAIGAVQGFAFTLGLSTLVDVLIVFLFTHPLVALVARSKTFTSPRISGLGAMRDTPAASAAPVAAGRVSTKES